MKSWQLLTSKYFLTLTFVVLLCLTLFLLVDSFKSRQVKESLTSYMGNLRDIVFMSTYDSLKKGNMKVFKDHLEEVGTFDDVKEFSLLDTKGVVNYSSEPKLVKQVDSNVLGLGHQLESSKEGFTTYYFPVETISYCSRCHSDWKIGSINSYYKLTLSRKALDAAELGTFYYHGFAVVGSGAFLAFIYMLFLLYERRKHEEQMQLSASVFENAVEAIVITTFEGQVIRINPAFSQITGFEAEDILEQDIHLLDAGEINREIYREMRKKLREKGRWSGEIWNKRKSGDSFPVRLSVTAVKNAQNRTTHFVSIFHDITTKKAAENALVKMGQMKSEFISCAAHELLTPLTAIMGFTEIVREPEKFGGFTEEQIKDFLDEVYDRGEALSQIIDDLLDISRIDSGKPIELNLEQVCLTSVLGKVVEFYRVNNSKHTYRLDLPEPSDKTLCLIDRYRINQVLENLLSNATKYSPKGSEVCLKCRIKADLWEISVADNGIGMNPEQVERVFDKFYRAHSSDTSVSGLGLGMSIAKQIVEYHGGNVHVRSAEGVGTTVTFTLPLVSE